MTHKLMIKKHNQTGLKYLCYTQKSGKDYVEYLGSGKIWKSHLKKYGCDIETILLYETENYEDFVKTSIIKSVELDIVNSTEWANLKIEDGTGGDTVSNKKWITDGNSDKYINKNDILPAGWKYGRSKCVFNDVEKQKDFGSRADITHRGEQIKKAWGSGKMDNRDHSKCGVKGENNPAKRTENREKIRQWALSNAVVSSKRMSELRKNGTITKKKKYE